MTKPDNPNRKVPLQVYFDCSSPWTYLGFMSVRQSEILARHADIQWCPVLVGGVFNAVNQEVYAARANPAPRKFAYNQKDLRDWSKYVGIQIGDPPVFPVNSVRIMRGAFVAEEAGCLEPYAELAFSRYWTDLADISQEDEVKHIAASVGLEPHSFWASINLPEYKDKLTRSTQSLIDKGGFGSPTFFVNKTEMFFGNDRLPLVEARVLEVQ